MERGVFMNKFLDAISDKLLPLANKLGSNRYLAILRDAFMLAFPLTMFGSIVVVICNLPFLSDDLKSLLSELFGSAQSATMSIMTVFVTWGIGYYLSKSYDEDGIFGGVRTVHLVNADVQSQILHHGSILLFQVSQHPHPLIRMSGEGKGSK